MGTVTTVERKPRDKEIVKFGPEFLPGIWYGTDWWDLARAVEARKHHIHPNMHAFIYQMVGKTKRPTIGQLSMLTGLLIQAMTKEHLLKMEAAPLPKMADVVPLKRQAKEKADTEKSGGRSSYELGSAGNGTESR